MNQVILVGRVGKKPEYTETPSGVQIAKFSIATTESYKDNGEWKKKTLWHRIVVFGKRASVVDQIVDQGTMIAVSGRISYNEYTKDGVTRKTTEIICDDFTVMFPPKDKDKTDAPRHDDMPPYTDDDIPF